MKTIEKSTLDFLKSLKVNNNREWFLANKAHYIESKENYESFVQEVINKLTDFEPIMKGLEVKSCVYRINRDIRFSNDKSPYKAHLGAFIVRGGKKNGDRFPGYYIHIEPGNNMIAGGSYMPPAPWLASIREKIDKNPDELINTINSRDFIKYFGKIEGDKLKKAPKGYPSDHPNVELLKYKSYLVSNEVNDKEVLGENFFDHVVSVCQVMKPFNDFLNNY